jgi:hypothetical protein
MICKAVACCPPATRDAGYATPAALVFSLALALLGSALTLQSVHQLWLCKAELVRSQQEFVLDGAHLQAVATIVRSGAPGPFAWAISTDSGWVQVWAEPEIDKLSPAAAAQLDPAVFAAFGVAQPQALAARLTGADVASGAVAVAELDPAPLWRACGPSLVSPLGQASTFAYVTHPAPPETPGTPLWHIGEAWRVNITTETGWRDDRIVRFTGDARHPSAVVLRRLTRGGLPICDGLLANLPAA